MTGIIQPPTQLAGTPGIAPNFRYMTTSDSLQTIMTPGYLNNPSLEAVPLSSGDVIQCLYSVNTSTRTSTYGVFTVNIAKATGVITLTNWSSALSTSTILTAAQINGMYAAPVLVVPAPGAGRAIVVNGLAWNFVYGSAAFASGGVVTLQYGSTVHAGGTLTTTGIAAASVIGVTANSLLTDTAIPIVATSANTVNAGIYISNATGAFTTGTGTTSTLTVFYTIIPAT